MKTLKKIFAALVFLVTLMLLCSALIMAMAEVVYLLSKVPILLFAFALSPLVVGLIIWAFAWSFGVVKNGGKKLDV